MSQLPIGMLALALAMTACAPTHTPAPSNPATTSVATPAPAGAMAKRAPPRPGEQVSPLVAFRGAGRDWSLEIENAGGLAHDAQLTWGNGSQHATGTLRYDGAAGTAADAPILLVGTLATKAGRRTLRVEITPAACTQGTDSAYTHAVQATVEGLAPMFGCGDLAK